MARISLSLKAPPPACRARVIAWAVGCALSAGILAGCALSASMMPESLGDASTAPADHARITDGCAPEDIRRKDDRVCATCASTSGFVDICGAPSVARCESREDSEGRPCRLCATDVGEILYDSCFTDAQPAAALCEVVAGASGGDGGGAEKEDDIVCASCVDEDGRVVSTICEPAHDACRIVESDRRTCRECTRDGAVVIFTCEEPRLEPRSCEVYADASGRCVDCYDDADQLIMHSCTLTEKDVGCSQIVTAEGLTCDVCVDASGAVVSNVCSGAARRLERCTFLEFTEQRCLVCLDESDAVALTRCQPAACAGPECPAPPACAWERSDEGQWCRVCPLGQDASETRCIEETQLVCTSEADSASGAQAACITCADARTGVDVYRRCEGGAEGPYPLPPPACMVIDVGSGTEEAAQCEVCTDPQAGRQVYARCEEQTCYDAGAFQLLEPEGLPYFIDGRPAVASCASCITAVGEAEDTYASFATCVARSECGPIDLVDPTSPCDGAVTFTVLPRACGNPWDPSSGVGGPFSSVGDVRSALEVITFALETAGVGLLAVAAMPAASVSCSEGCACPRGDELLVSARAADAEAVRSLFGELIEPCTDDAGCGSGAVCRIDGGCGY